MTKKIKKVDPEIGRRLKEEIKRKKTTQKDLAAKLFMSQQNMNQICNGTTALTPTNAAILAKYFGVRPEYLLNLDDYRTYSVEWMKNGDSEEAKREAIFEHCLEYWGYQIAGSPVDQVEDQVIGGVYKILAPGAEEPVLIPNERIEEMQKELLQSAKRMIRDMMDPEF